MDWESRIILVFVVVVGKEDRGSLGEISTLLTGIRQGHGNSLTILDLIFIALCHS